MDVPTPSPWGARPRSPACHMGIPKGNADFVYNMCVAWVPVRLKNISSFLKNPIDISFPVCYHTITPRNTGPTQGHTTGHRPGGRAKVHLDKLIPERHQRQAGEVTHIASQGEPKGRSGRNLYWRSKTWKSGNRTKRPA